MREPLPQPSTPSWLLWSPTPTDSKQLVLARHGSHLLSSPPHSPPPPGCSAHIYVLFCKKKKKCAKVSGTLRQFFCLPCPDPTCAPHPTLNDTYKTVLPSGKGSQQSPRGPVASGRGDSSCKGSSWVNFRTAAPTLHPSDLTPGLAGVGREGEGRSEGCVGPWGATE